MRFNLTYYPRICLERMRITKSIIQDSDPPGWDSTPENTTYETRVLPFIVMFGTNSLHGTRTLEKSTVVRLLKIFQFMEAVGSLPGSLQRASGPYFEPDESSRYHSILLSHVFYSNDSGVHWKIINHSTRTGRPNIREDNQISHLITNFGRN